MTRLLLFVVSLMLTGVVFARQLTVEEALDRAMSKMGQSQSMRARSLATGASVSSVTLSQTMSSEASNAKLFYVFDISDGGFIIASADSRAGSLLGYTENGSFDMAKENPAFKEWLDDCTNALQWLSEQPDFGLENESTATRAEVLTPVAPLLGDIKWGQDEPYNMYTPKRSGKHAPTGCVATALAQVMMYYKWPETGEGSHTNINEESQTIDFSKSKYDWAAMKPKYAVDDESASAKAVATLMNDVGCALDMQYGESESGSNTYSLMTALATYFKYNKGLIRLQRKMFTTDDWNEVLRRELNDEHPILFSAGAPSGGGHQFVLDGYDANGLYHVNWGWNGKSDGYFDINVLDPDFQGTGGYAGGYALRQDALIGVQPDRDGKSVAAPKMEICSQFIYKIENNTFWLSVENTGLGEFAGEIGLEIMHPDGTFSKARPYSFASTPLTLGKYVELEFDAPKADAEGYLVRPYYSKTVGGKEERLEASLATLTTWGTYIDEQGELRWGYYKNEYPSLTITDKSISGNYAGFAPKFKFSIKKEDITKYEYNDAIQVYVFKTVSDKDELVGKGISQLFINPGESKELVVDVCLDKDGSRLKDGLSEGEYKYLVLYNIGSYIYELTDFIDFTVEKSTPSNLTYSEFAIDKKEIKQGELLTATMKIKNTGGYDERKYEFVMFKEDDYNNYVAYFSANVCIEADETVIATMKGLIDLEPGRYVGAFFDDQSGKQLCNILKFTVGATALDEIPNVESDQPKVMYDINGKPATQLQKGKVYIGNGKIIVR